MSVRGIIDLAQKVVVTRWLRAPDQIELTLDARRNYGDELQLKRIIYAPDLDYSAPLAFMIEQIELDKDDHGQVLTVSGRTLDGMALVERLCWPDPASYPLDTLGHDEQTAVPAETAMKHYIEYNAGPSAHVNRRVPGFYVATDAARGSTVTVAARYQAVFDIEKEIAFAADMGWKVLFDEATGHHIFDVIVPADLSSLVTLDLGEFQTLSRWQEVSSLPGSKTLAIVAGQGELTARDIVIRPAVEPTGLDRREGFVDARDVVVGATALLQQRGDAVIAATASQTSVVVTARQGGAFQYPVNYGLGDYVLAEDAERGLSEVKQVVGVRITVEQSAGVPVVEPILDKPDPAVSTAFYGGRVDSGVVGGGGGGLTDHTHQVTGAGATGGGGTVKPALLVVPGALTPVPTAVGETWWDTDEFVLVVGDGAGRKYIGYQANTLPTTQAFGDAAANGSGNENARVTHKHAMPANPITAHEAAADPHTAYQRESEKDADSGYAGLGAAQGTRDGTKFLRDDGTWQAASGGSGAPTTADYLVGTIQAGLSAEIVVGTTPGGELGGTWASPTVDASHGGGTHAAAQAAAEATAAAAAATHAAAADPHTGYRLESADHSHASAGLQGGTVAHSALTGITENDHGRWTAIITKPADESVTTSTAMQNDDDFFFTTVDLAHYEVEMVLLYINTAGSTGDLKCDFGEDTNSRGTVQGIGLSSADAASTQQAISNQTGTIIFGAATGERTALIRGAFRGAGGVWRMRWAQNSSSGTTKVLLGSVMRYRRIV